MPNKPQPHTRPIISAVPSPELLHAYGEISPAMAVYVMQEAVNRNRRAFQYAMAGLLIGAVLGLSLITAFVYLVMEGHSAAAGVLLGGGALSMVAGFRSTRL